MTPGSTPSETAVQDTVFEVERFEWTAPDRIELTGVWTGVRGMRFIRPTLVLEGEGRRVRLLALLEHKPWPADDGTDWKAAFAWEGDKIAAESAELSVASGIDLELPAPRKTVAKAPRRFRHKVTARELPRDEEHDLLRRKRTGIVSEAPAMHPPSADPPAELPPVEEPEPAASAHGGVDSARERAAAAEIRAGQLLQERDEALARRKAISAEFTKSTENHEASAREGRAAEREETTRLLAEGADLRSGVERQREMALLERDKAVEARDEAVGAMEQAVAERKQALADRKAAFRERDKAQVERDQALGERERAESARAKALGERDAATAERDSARSERDGVVAAQERGLPVVPPQPRHLPAEPARSRVEVWTPRAAALGALGVLALIIFRLFAGL